jgi:hypothetical protein
MKNLYTLLIATIIIVSTNSLNAQGCVAVKSMGCSGQSSSTSLAKGQFEFSANMRYFESFRHFVGDVEQHERLEKHTEVRIQSFNYDFAINYGISNHFYLSFDLPYISNNRSNNHYTDANGVAQRFKVEAKGIGDIRISGYYTANTTLGGRNLSIVGGLGIKLPTGETEVLDVFHTLSSKKLDSTYIKPVDQAIQPGDGGTGVSVEAQLAYSLSSKLTAYITGYYLIQPETQSTALYRVNLANADPTLSYLSICDQYLARVGVGYNTGKWSFSLGGRLEGIPAHDLFGSSIGRRRPGYIVDAEPGISYSNGTDRLSLNVPVALYRNRTKSVYDLADPEGKRHGDAAFADYAISLGFVHTFGSPHMEMVPLAQ